MTTDELAAAIHEVENMLDELARCPEVGEDWLRRAAELIDKVDSLLAAVHPPS